MDEVALLRALVQGDRAAVSTMIDHVFPTVYGYVLALVTDVSTAERVMEDTFRELKRSAAAFPRNGNLAEWICAMARGWIVRSFEDERGQTSRAPARALRSDPTDEPELVVDLNEREPILVLDEPDAAPDARASLADGAAS